MSLVGEQNRNIFLEARAHLWNHSTMGARGSRLETDFEKQWDQVSFADMREWHAVYGKCRLCAHRKELDLKKLMRLHGKDALLVDVQTRLKCQICRNGVANEIEVERLPRNL